MTNSPTAALLWEIWRRHQAKALAVIALTVAARLMHLSRTAADSDPLSTLIDLLGMACGVLLLGIFNYTDSSEARGLGGFPRRLFVLPVSSLRLVAVPMLAAIASVELLYLSWMDLASRGGTTTAPFIALLLAVLMVCYQSALWVFERLGILRLIIVGGTVFGVFVIGQLPSLPPSPGPPWRSEGVLSVAVAAVAVTAFLLAWWHVVRQRGGGRRGALQLEAIIDAVAAGMPGTRGAFPSPSAAQFWFEWRCSGLALPVLVGAYLVLVVGPASWQWRNDAGRTFNLLLAALATPLVVALPVGMAFAKATFWSNELAVPPLVAVVPLDDEEIVAVKLKVAAASVVTAWLLVLLFLAAWLSLWANLDAVSQFAITLWALHGQSIAAVYGIAALVIASGMCLTWRLLVSRLWSGLAGSRLLFNVSVLSVVVGGIAFVVFDGLEFPGWLLADPERMRRVVWVLAVAVIVKYWLAAYAWRHVSTRHARQYFVAWAVATAVLLTLAATFWNVARIYIAQDAYRLQALLMLLALLAVPVARIGFAPSSLARNRHR